MFSLKIGEIPIPSWTRTTPLYKEVRKKILGGGGGLGANPHKREGTPLPYPPHYSALHASRTPHPRLSSGSATGSNISEFAPGAGWGHCIFWTPRPLWLAEMVFVFILKVQTIIKTSAWEQYKEHHCETLKRREGESWGVVILMVHALHDFLSLSLLFFYFLFFFLFYFFIFFFFLVREIASNWLMCAFDRGISIHKHTRRNPATPKRIGIARRIKERRFRSPDTHLTNVQIEISVWWLRIVNIKYL